MIKKWIDHHLTKYIIVGVLTTLVNFSIFILLKDHMDLMFANFVSIICAIIFAYFANARFVFYSKAETYLQMLKELLTFFSARIITMLIELIGVWFLVDVLFQNDLISKVIINVIVLIVNYVLSLFIFRKK